jgi:hypothetical protein
MRPELAPPNPSPTQWSKLGTLSFQVCTEFMTVSLKDDGSLLHDSDQAHVDMLKPIVFKLSSKAVGEDGMFKHSAKAAATLGDKFKIDAVRSEGGRTHRKIPEEAALELQKFADTMFPGQVLPDTKFTAAAKQDVVPTAFAIAKDKMTCSPEFGHIPNIRLGIRGTRYVVVAPTHELLVYLVGMSNVPVDLAKVNHWLKTTNVDGLKTFIDKSPSHAVFCGTVGPGDVLYIPAGHLFYERISGISDFLGVRLPILCLKSLPILRLLNGELVKLESPSAPLQRALDCLTLAED